MKKVLKRCIQSALIFIVLLILLFFIGIAWPPLDLLAPPRSTGPIALTNITLINLDRGDLAQNRTVLVIDDRIAAIGHSDSLSLPAETQRIDGTGRYLLPGFWDMHVHLTRVSPVLHYPLFTAFGVTNIRDMGLGSLQSCQESGDPFFICPEDKSLWNQQVDAGSLVGPRLFATPIVQIETLADLGLSEEGPDSTTIRDQTRTFVQALKQRGADFIKLQLEEPLPSIVLEALMDEAQQVALPVVGHQPKQLSVIEAAQVGMKSIEHARVFVQACYPEATAYRRGEIEWSASVYQAMIEQHDPDLCDSIFAAFIENDTWFSPTHVTRRWEAMQHDPDYREDERLSQVPGWQRLLWNIDAFFISQAAPTNEDRKALQDFYTFGLELTGRAHQRGVKLLAGTDAFDSYAFYGSGLHDELEELVKAGLTPAEALRTATINPASFFGVIEDYGSVSQGKKADLIVLTANPLEDIRHTRHIEAVIVNGGFYDRIYLNRLIESVESVAGSADFFNLDQYSSLF